VTSVSDQKDPTKIVATVTKMIDTQNVTLTPSLPPTKKHACWLFLLFHHGDLHTAFVPLGNCNRMGTAIATTLLLEQNDNYLLIAI
jgi:hypothetical protein